MYLGENVVAQVWSFKNDWQEVPYRIMRVGSHKKQGGGSYKWTCSCPAFSYRGRGVTCKHLISLKEKAKDGTLLYDNHFILSGFGKEIFKIG
jgi:hypothetical protein